MKKSVFFSYLIFILVVHPVFADDNTPSPSITFLSPERDSILKGDIKFEIKLDEKLSNPVFFSKDKELGKGKGVQEVRTFIWQTTPEDNGKHIITVVADLVDKENVTKVTSEEFPVTVDNTPPEVNFHLEKLVVGGKLDLTVSAKDEVSGIKDAAFFIDDKDVAKDIDPTDGWGYSLNTKDLPDGEHVIKVVVSDKAGNITEVTQKIICDNSAPRIKIMSPGDKACCKGSILIYTEASDPSDISSVHLLVSGNIAEEGKLHEKLWLISWTPEKDGIYKLAARAVDNAGNEANSQEITITYDNTPPEAEWIQPKPGDTVKGNTTLQAKANDLSSKVEEVVFMVNGQEVGRDNNPEDGWTYDWKPTGEGCYSLSLKATDTAGNQKILEPFEVIVDSTPPVLNILSPKSGVVLGCTTELRIEANDNLSGVEVVEALCDGNKLSSLSKEGNTWIFSWTATSDGKVTFTVNAVDKSGNTASITTDPFDVDITPPVLTLLSPSKDETVYGKEANIEFECVDKVSGVDQGVLPSVRAIFKDKSFPVSAVSWENGIWKGKLVLSEDLFKGNGEIEVATVRDKVGNEIKPQIIGSLNIRPSGGPWPLHSGLPQPLRAGYGQFIFCGNNGNSRLLGGIEISGEPGTPVTAIEPGRILEVVAIGSSYIMRIQRPVENMVWGYHRIRIGLNPRAGRGWLPGDRVESGDVLGVIADNPLAARVVPSYLFLEVVQQKESEWVCVANPLRFLVPNTDTVQPCIMHPLIFRNGSAEGIKGAQYIQGDKPILSGRVDIIAYAWDTFDQFPAKLPVTKIGFSIEGHGTIPFENLIDFSESLPKDQNIYESAITNEEGPFPYILTNASDFSPDPSNAWNTAGCEGFPWYTMNSAPTQDKNRFKDGEYQIIVQASDLAGNICKMTQSVVLDNFAPYVTELTITQGANTIYRGCRKYDKDALTLVVQENAPVEVWGDLKATVVFSEPVIPESVSIYFDMGEDTHLDFKDLKPVTEKGDSFCATLILMEKEKELLFKGNEMAISVIAKDITGNLLDSDPTMVPRRPQTPLQDFENYKPGPDKTHKIGFRKIESKEK